MGFTLYIVPSKFSSLQQFLTPTKPLHGDLVSLNSRGFILVVLVQDENNVTWLFARVDRGTWSMHAQTLFALFVEPGSKGINVGRLRPGKSGQVGSSVRYLSTWKLYTLNPARIGAGSYLIQQE